MPKRSYKETIMENANIEFQSLAEKARERRPRGGSWRAMKNRAGRGWCGAARAGKQPKQRKERLQPGKNRVCHSRQQFINR